jgi:hypothetical protein
MGGWRGRCGSWRTMVRQHHDGLVRLLLYLDKVGATGSHFGFPVAGDVGCLCVGGRGWEGRAR